MKFDLKGNETYVRLTYLFELHFFDALPLRSLCRLLFNISKPTINRLRAIFAGARASATPTATNRYQLHLFAVDSGWLHPLHHTRIFLPNRNNCNSRINFVGNFIENFALSLSPSFIGNFVAYAIPSERTARQSSLIAINPSKSHLLKSKNLAP